MLTVRFGRHNPQQLHLYNGVRRQRMLYEMEHPRGFGAASAPSVTRHPCLSEEECDGATREVTDVVIDAVTLGVAPSLPLLAAPNGGGRDKGNEAQRK
jgi:NAD(P)H-flavin reductase